MKTSVFCNACTPWTRLSPQKCDTGVPPDVVETDQFQVLSCKGAVALEKKPPKGLPWGSILLPRVVRKQESTKRF